MNMTPEQKAQWLDAAQSLLDGEPIEFELMPGDWRNTDRIDMRYPHRRKPKPDPLAALKALHASGVRIEARQYPPESHAWHHVAHPNWSLDFEWRAVLWTLPPPPAGQEWHRTDWTEDMLPEGWRPLLYDEIPQFGDQVWEFGKGPWGKYVTAEPRHSAHNHTRTMRPLPAPPSMVPLTRGDVPFGSVFRAVSGSDFLPLQIGDNGARFWLTGDLGDRSWLQLQQLGWLIHRPGDNDADGKPVFRKCEKEETK